MSIKVKQLQPSNAPAWDAYVHAHPGATLYHLSGWKNIIEKTYGHKTYYLMAVKKNCQSPIHSLKQDSGEQLQGKGPVISPDEVRRRRVAFHHFHQESDKNNKHPENPVNPVCLSDPNDQIVGILPLMHLKHFLFGNSLISIPFFDMGGVLADDEEIEKALLSEAIRLGQDMKADTIELRHFEPLTWLADSSQLIADSSKSSSINSPFPRRRTFTPCNAGPACPVGPAGIVQG